MPSWTSLYFYEKPFDGVKVDSEEMSFWCRANCTKDWYHTSKQVSQPIVPLKPQGITYEHRFCFSSNDDAVMFKLTWGGA